MNLWSANINQIVQHRVIESRVLGEEYRRHVVLDRVFHQSSHNTAFADACLVANNQRPAVFDVVDSLRQCVDLFRRKVFAKVGSVWVSQLCRNVACEVSNLITQRFQCFAHRPLKVDGGQ